MQSCFKDLKYRNVIRKWNFIVVLRIFLLKRGIAQPVLFNVLTYSALALILWYCKMKSVLFSPAPADVEGNTETATVVDLFPWMEYEFRVVATSALGTGEPSSPSPKDKTLEASKTVS